MKATICKFLNTKTMEPEWGIKIRRGKEVFYGSENGKPLVSTDRKFIMDKIKAFNSASAGNGA